MRAEDPIMLPTDLKHIINYDEKVIFAVHGKELIVATNQRILLQKSQGLGLRKSTVDYPYSNMVNVKFQQGLRKASLEILMRSGVESVKIANLSKPDAYQLHRVIAENIFRSSQPPHPFPVMIQGEPRKGIALEDGRLRCPRCYEAVSSDFALCPFCGYKLKMECPECGKKLDQKFKICPYCGENISVAENIDLNL